MTQTHRFTEPYPIIDLAQLKRVWVRVQSLEPLFIPDEEYEAWLDERWADQWEIVE